MRASILVAGLVLCPMSFTRRQLQAFLDRALLLTLPSRTDSNQATIWGLLLSPKISLFARRPRPLFRITLLHSQTEDPPDSDSYSKFKNLKNVFH